MPNLCCLSPLKSPHFIAATATQGIIAVPKKQSAKTKPLLKMNAIAAISAIKSEVSPKSHERYAELLRGFIVPELGAILMAKLVPAHIQAACTKWTTTGRRDGKVGPPSPPTRRHIHRVFSSALARAVEQQVIARNPADAFKKRLPKVERQEMQTLTADQSALLLAAIK